MKTCVAANCSTRNGSGPSFHSFPSDLSLIAAWVDFVLMKRKNWQHTLGSFLCSDHFAESCYDQRQKLVLRLGLKPMVKRLLPGSVPTIHKNLQPKSGQLPEWPDVDKISTSTKRKRSDDDEGQRERTRIVENLMNRQSTPAKSSVRVTIASAVLEEEDSLASRGLITTAPVTVKQLTTIAASASTCTTATKAKSCQTSKRATGVYIRSQYCQTTPKRKTIGTSTESVQTCTIGVQCSLLDDPVNSPHHEDESDTDTEEEILNDKKDPTWLPSTDTEEDSDTEYDSFQTRPPEKERKFMVFESCLLSLFASCPACSSSTQVKTTTIGTFLSIHQTCDSCGFTRKWDSQPFLGNTPAGNFLLSASILYSGSLPSKSLLLLRHLGLASISKSTFFRHQQTILIPTVQQFWKEEQQMMLDEARFTGVPITIGGDGRADTPGHNAKYGSYTFMDLDSNKILHIELVQSNEVKNSNAMEKEGLSRGVAFLREEDVEIGTMVTDRHLQIQKWIREEMPYCIHYYDIWHVTKALRKKMEALSKEKDCEAVAPWIRSIIRHMYWVAQSTPDGNGDVMLDKWKSVVNHIQNIHSGHGDNFPECLHENPPTKKKKWLKSGTKACELLSLLLEKPQLLKDVKKLSPVHQTSSVETFHSLINHFAPKMIVFSHLGMSTRLLIAALHFNENGDREAAVTRNGDQQYKVDYPKHKKGQPVVKQRKTAITYKYAERLLVKTCEQARAAEDERLSTPGRVPEPISHRFQKMEKEEAVARHCSRFGKKKT